MADDKTHWGVTLNRRNRSLFFALGFLVLGTHLHDLQAGATMWLLLALQLLVYPQLVYWRARRSADPLRAEQQNLLVDGLLLGMWMAVWGLPLWISFMLCIGVCLNVVMFMGLPNLWKGMAALGGGVALVALVHGVSFRPDTGLATSLLSILLLTMYLLFFANDAFKRAISLRDSRRQLGERLAEITALQARLEEQAQRDPMTGLYNRRYLDEALERELATCRRSGTPLSLVLIDIDHFKRINDTYGHPAGDEMIRRLADLLADRVRNTGLVVCRYGGEEFLLMLPGTEMAEAALLAEDLCASFEAMRVDTGGGVMRATLSVGIAGFPEHAPKAQALVREADQALYAAKLGGRNRVVLSTSIGPDPQERSQAHGPEMVPGAVSPACRR
ncbi:diguanylate cyclase [Luteimonas sp. R10]|uniref:sensor domain-containing diguanylate cyclase n=1 Tax=Luteimonas sp. R10 TaxID=3108176 RepID=UPI003087AB0C|nr:diguanylate cyclase [Luteimonas sp. R10]